MVKNIRPHNIFASFPVDWTLTINTIFNGARITQLLQLLNGTAIIRITTEHLILDRRMSFWEISFFLVQTPVADADWSLNGGEVRWTLSSCGGSVCQNNVRFPTLLLLVARWGPSILAHSLYYKRPGDHGVALFLLYPLSHLHNLRL